MKFCHLHYIDRLEFEKTESIYKIIDEKNPDTYMRIELGDARYFLAYQGHLVGRLKGRSSLQ
ncbi:hypothetical protein [Chitinophaga sp. sic0106]|uniref:hypothetical protein n=1 Tax=Chitinophaga sp. sic0106 TaxID=2854785 RepID=UPI001C44C494|nr:hypothetical protein [Chitinophaga sp. sic0106]MBV7529419.1 hypothetical protein [Chitinophaga sp. sic0106]